MILNHNGFIYLFIFKRLILHNSSKDKFRLEIENNSLGSDFAPSNPLGSDFASFYGFGSPFLSSGIKIFP